MNFEQARKFSIPFGKHRGVPLEAVLFVHPSYLTWLKREWKFRPGPFKDAFDVFMADESTVKTLENQELDNQYGRQQWR